MGSLTIKQILERTAHVAINKLNIAIFIRLFIYQYGRKGYEGFYCCYYEDDDRAGLRRAIFFSFLPCAIHVCIQHILHISIDIFSPFLLQG